MGKQSARLYYQRKDHKDIHYNGMYHNAMMFNGELVWRKLRDEAYYAVSTLLFNSSAQRYIYYEAILYPAKKVRHVHALDHAQNLTHNDTSVFGSYTGGKLEPASNIAIASSDAKLYHRIPLESYGGGTLPVRGGFICRKKDNKVVFVAVSTDGAFEENEIGEYGSLHPVYIGGECPDGVIAISSDGNYLILKSDGTTSPILIADTTLINVGYGYGNGMYIILQTVASSGGSVLYARIIKENTSWRRYTTSIPYNYYYNKVAMLYRDGRFILYIQPALGYGGRLRIYETEDFRSFKEVPVLAKKLSLKYINSDGYIDLILDSSAQVEEGHLKCNNFNIVNNIFFEDQKKADSSGLVFFEQGTELSGYIYTTFYIDNLYFEESDGNFAVNGSYDFGDIHAVF